MKAKTKWNKRQVRINKFYKFLIAHDCFVEYRNNVRKSKWETLTTIFNHPIDKWINTAFSWTNSTEGIDYWCHIAIEWDDFRETEGIE